MKSKFIQELVVASVAALVVVGGYLLSEAYPRSPRPWPDQRLSADLERIVPGEIVFDGTLQQAVEMLSMTGARIEADLELRMSNPTRRLGDVPISLRLHDATVRQWMYAIGFQASLVQFDDGYWLDEHGVIHLTERHSQNPPRVTQVYDVRDILDHATRWSALFPSQPAERTLPPGTIVMDRRADADRNLDNFIRATAGRGTWDYTGSGGWPSWGHLMCIDGRLIISQTPQAHREIEVLLAVLRARRMQHHEED
jgi:hypothetical protein